MVSREKIYDKIYKVMETSNKKGLKMVLKKNIQGVLFINLPNIDPPLSYNEKIDYIYRTQTYIDILIRHIILKDGNREKIKLRNFYCKSHKKLWNKYPVF